MTKTNENMRQISIEEMFTLMNLNYQGRHIEIDLSPILSSNTYHWFSVKEINDVVEFLDRDNNHPQMLRIKKSDINEILYNEGENVFRSEFVINMVNSQQIHICVYEEPIYCQRCLRILNLGKIEYEHIWEVNGSAGYSSHFDGEGNICVKICDDCMYEFIYGEKFVDLGGFCDEDGEVCELH